MATTEVIPYVPKAPVMQDLDKQTLRYLKDRDNKELLITLLDKTAGHAKDLTLGLLTSPAIALVAGFVLTEYLQTKYRKVETSPGGYEYLPYMPQMAGNALEVVLALPVMVEALGIAAAGITKKGA